MEKVYVLLNGNENMRMWRQPLLNNGIMQNPTFRDGLMIQRYNQFMSRKYIGNYLHDPVKLAENFFIPPPIHNH